VWGWESFTVLTITSWVASNNAYESISSIWEHRRSSCLSCNFICLLMRFWNSDKSSSWSYSSSVSSSPLSSELDVEQSSSSAKVIFVLPKLNTSVWKTGQFYFYRLADSTFSSWVWLLFLTLIKMCRWWWDILLSTWWWSLAIAWAIHLLKRLPKKISSFRPTILHFDLIFYFCTKGTR
jgi:hypothetical protein